MQIEFISCTSAGKSTLVQRMLHIYQEQKPELKHSYDFVLQRMHLAWIANRSLRVIAVNALALGMCLLAWRRHHLFLTYTLARVRQLNVNVSLLERLKIIRIILRNVGVHEFVERYSASEDVVIADEGFLQIAHYLLVHTAVEPRVEQIETFAKLVPLPRVVVYIRQPDALLIERTLQRGHKRIPTGSPELVKLFVSRATTMFEILIRQPAICGRLLIIDGQQRILLHSHSDLEPPLERACNLIRLALSIAGQTKTARGLGNWA